MKLGTKIQKPINEAQYTEAAAWCMSNGAIIVDKGDYYEVCENVPPEPTKEEKLAMLDSEYTRQKALLIEQYTDDMLHGDTAAIESDKQSMIDLDTWYDEEYKKIEGGED